METESEEGLDPAGLGEEGTTSLRLTTRLIVPLLISFINKLKLFCILDLRCSMLSESQGRAHEEQISSVQLLDVIDILVTKDSSPVQPRNIKFPLHLIGKQYRAFAVSLYDKYPSIEYSQSKDAIFCYYCRHFAKDRKEPTFVSEGFQNWKKCYGTKRSDNKLLQHNASFQHSECVDAHAHYIAVKTIGVREPPQSFEKLPNSGKTLAKIFAMIRARITASCGQK